jgi:hypothetical protein
MYKLNLVWFFWQIGIIFILSAFFSQLQAQTDCNATVCNADGENCQRVSLMPVQQCETLLALYYATQGTDWRVNDNWNVSNEPREFARVETDADGEVIALNLQENNLTGALPELTALTHLTTLNLYVNRLTGAIPDLTTLTQLTTLNLRNNQLSGSIPDLSALTQLEELSFYHNKLCGQIPDLSSLKNIKRLDLSDNQLSGPIPDLSQLTQLKNLGLARNDLCRKAENDYTGFEYAVDRYPLCSADDEYPACEEPQPPLIPTNQAILTISKDGTGQGRIVGKGIDCGTDCSEAVVKNTVVTLTAEATSDSAFMGWNGSCFGVEPTCQLTLTADQSVSATFDLIAPPDYTLTVSKTGSGTISGEGINCGNDCSEVYPANTSVTLMATPAADSRFVSWQGACSAVTGNPPPPCQLTMSQAHQVTATFAPQPTTTTFTLIITKDGSGIGSVTGEGIDCGAICSASYVENTVINLTAIPGTDTTFIGWNGACVGSEISCQIMMNQIQQVTATFNLLSSAASTDLEFVGIKPNYNVGELFTLDLVEHLTTAPRSSEVDLWVAVESPSKVFHFMTEQPLQPFSLTPQPFRRHLPSIELVQSNFTYHLLYFDIPAGIGGSYNFYAIYNEANADLSNLFFTQQSEIAFATTTFSNQINPPILPTPPTTLSLLVNEQVELIVDANETFDAIRFSCHINPLDIVQSYTAISSSGTGVSCYLTALRKGNATLLTTDKDGNTRETLIIVK